MKEVKENELSKYINKIIDVTVIDKKIRYLSYSLAYWNIATIRNVVLLGYDNNTQEVTYKLQSGNITKVNPLKIELV